MVFGDEDRQRGTRESRGALGKIREVW